MAHDRTFGPAPGDAGHVLTVKNRAEELLAAIFDGFKAQAQLTPAQERCRACAKTRLEESIMWAVRGLREGLETRV